MRDHLVALIAAIAVLVGGLSFAGGVMAQRAADHKVCQVTVHENAAIRGLVNDFTLKNPKVTPKQLADVQAITKARFPDHC